MTHPDDVYAFTRSSIKSVWALELLLVLKREPGRAWGPDELVRELRGSATAISEATGQLTSAGLITQEAGAYRYQPASNNLDLMVRNVENLYRERPIAVMKAIMTAPNEKLRVFSDAFKLKD